STGEEALELVGAGEVVQIAILDVMLPGISGLEVCQKLRNEYPRMGIIMLTAKGQETDKVEGLEVGADDYVVKPFSPAELVARVKSLQRRLQLVPLPDDKHEVLNQLTIGPFTLSLDEHKLFKHSKEVELTPTEFQIIQLFVEHPNKAISRDQILNHIWGKHYIGDLKIVDVNIRRIRQKIEEDSSQPQFIQTVWGVGYLWRKE
ncbi:response regulator transcription factor, partial [Brevibacillus sp. SYSU BS000544]|uniref:response regulator transcription factor n=1 Tax=Brevibacillus sp. SYSU BS000544 TaxID=3416443 RepID=UPI003CE57982